MPASERSKSSSQTLSPQTILVSCKAHICCLGEPSQVPGDWHGHEAYLFWESCRLSSKQKPVSLSVQAYAKAGAALVIEHTEKQHNVSTNEDGNDHVYCITSSTW